MRLKVYEELWDPDTGFCLWLKYENIILVVKICYQLINEFFHYHSVLQQLRNMKKNKLKTYKLNHCNVRRGQIDCVQTVEAAVPYWQMIPRQYSRRCGANSLQLQAGRNNYVHQENVLQYRGFSRLDRSYQGGLVVAISNTVQPTLQMSDLNPCPVSLITSGAIQYGVPKHINLWLQYLWPDISFLW